MTTDDRGLRCRQCECRHFLTLETRVTWGHRIRRRRSCRNCGTCITTYETSAERDRADRGATPSLAARPAAPPCEPSRLVEKPDLAKGRRRMTKT